MQILVSEVLCPQVGEESDKNVSRRKYLVQQNSNRNPEQFFSCKIDVKGAEVGRELLYFVISPPPSFTSTKLLYPATTGQSHHN